MRTSLEGDASGCSLRATARTQQVNQGEHAIRDDAKEAKKCEGSKHAEEKDKSHKIEMRA